MLLRSELGSVGGRDQRFGRRGSIHSMLDQFRARPIILAASSPGFLRFAARGRLPSPWRQRNVRASAIVRSYIYVGRPCTLDVLEAVYQPMLSGMRTMEMRPTTGSCSITRYLPMGVGATPRPSNQRSWRSRVNPRVRASASDSVGQIFACPPLVDHHH